MDNGRSLVSSPRKSVVLLAAASGARIVCFFYCTLLCSSSFPCIYFKLSWKEMLLRINSLVSSNFFLMDIVWEERQNTMLVIKEGCIWSFLPTGNLVKLQRLKLQPPHTSDGLWCLYFTSSVHHLALAFLIQCSFKCHKIERQKVNKNK